MKERFGRAVTVLVALMAAHASTAVPGLAQETDGGSSAAQASNPLANMTALNFRNYRQEGPLVRCGVETFESAEAKHRSGMSPSPPRRDA